LNGGVGFRGVMQGLAWFSSGAAFFFLTLYYQDTKSGLKTCQISLGLLAWKSCAMRGHYFGAEAWDLTFFPHLARNSVQRRSVVSGEVRMW
jgi:hypothetical protein